MVRKEAALYSLGQLFDITLSMFVPHDSRDPPFRSVAVDLGGSTEIVLVKQTSFQGTSDESFIRYPHD